MAKLRQPIPLDIPPKVDSVDSWLVVGLDPSLSRTGYAAMLVSPLLCRGINHDEAPAEWLAAGSVKPSETNEPVWVRSKAMALFLKDKITSLYEVVNPERHDPQCPECHGSGYYFEINNLKRECGCLLGTFHRPGLIISMEYPTPMNDFLVALNRILHAVFFEGDLCQKFSAIRVLTTNAATMRSLMGLKMRGSKNKKENILRAYEFIDKTGWPSLDTDSCDAVLHAIIARHAASIMLGLPNIVPERFKNVLCNSNKEIKGKGTRVRIITKGLLHRSEYWYPYERKEYTLLVKDAANPKPGLKRENFIL